MRFEAIDVKQALFDRIVAIAAAAGNTDSERLRAKWMAEAETLQRKAEALGALRSGGRKSSTDS